MFLENRNFFKDYSTIEILSDRQSQDAKVTDDRSLAATMLFGAVGLILYSVCVFFFVLFFLFVLFVFLFLLLGILFTILYKHCTFLHLFYLLLFL